MAVPVTGGLIKPEEFVAMAIIAGARLLLA